MKKLKKLKVYTKFCIPCIMLEEWQEFQKAAHERGYYVVVVRTTYRPLAHEMATELWGGDDYKYFVVFPNGKVKELEEIMKMWNNNVKNKRVKPGKKKGDSYDVQGLPKTARAIRVDGVEDSATKIEVAYDGL